MPQIEVTFEVDLEGKLTVVARDLQAGNHQEISLAVAPELSDVEIERMIRDAQDHLADDVEEQRKVEMRLRAESLISTVEKLLLRHEGEIPIELHAETETAIRGGKDAIDEGIVAQIEVAIQKLNNANYQLLSFVNAQVQETTKSLTVAENSAGWFRNREKVRG